MAAHATFARQKHVTEKVEADLASQRIQQRTVKKQLEVRTLARSVRSIFSTFFQRTNNKTYRMTNGYFTLLQADSWKGLMLISTTRSMTSPSQRSDRRMVAAFTKIHGGYKRLVVVCLFRPTAL